MTKVFTIDIVLHEPTILTDGSSDAGTGHESLSHVPGTTVLGALVPALGLDPARDRSLFARVFLDPGTRFLDAYPAVGDRRTLPLPRTFRQGKSRRECVVDRIDALGRPRSPADLERFFRESAGGDRMKAARDAFILEDAPGTDHSPGRREQVHVGIDRVRRAADQGVLFAYESIPAGGEFRAAVLVEDPEVSGVFSGIAGRGVPIRIGRSRGAGYGSAVALIRMAPDTWREYASTPGAVERENVVVTLLSDYLPPLETAPIAALEAELRSALDLPVQRSVRVIEAGLRTVRGFRAVWGLPRPPRTAVERGAVIVVEGPLDPAGVARVEMAGVGGRRNEGFGRVAFGWRVHGAEWAGRAGAAKEPVREAARPTAAVAGHASRVATALGQVRGERRRRRFVEIVVGSEPVRRAIDDLRQVPPSQLGNLRAMMTGGADRQTIGAWFSGVAAKSAGERWRGVRVRCFRTGDAVKRRDGVGFVWTNLFGGQTAAGGRSDELEGGPDFEAAVRDSLVPLCADGPLREAALADPDRTLRLFVVALCGDVVRARNLRATQGSRR